MRYRISAKTLLSLRVAADKTQWEVAAACGFKTAQFVSNWERGISMPPSKVLKRLCKAYGCPIENLLHTLYIQEEENLSKKYNGLFKRFKIA